MVGACLAWTLEADTETCRREWIGLHISNQIIRYIPPVYHIYTVIKRQSQVARLYGSTRASQCRHKKQMLAMLALSKCTDNILRISQSALQAHPASIVSVVSDVSVVIDLLLPSLFCTELDERSH